MRLLKCAFVTAALVPVLVFSCGKKDKDEDNVGNGRQLLPLISESVNKAKASGFDLTRSKLNVTATAPEAAEALRDFLSDNVQSISGITKAGWIEAYIADLDSRIKEVTSNEADPTCLSSTAVNVSFDTGIAGHQVTLPLQCVRAFGGGADQSGTGSGLAYGRSGNKYYIYLMLAQKEQANDKFGYAAMVDKDTDVVDLMFLEKSTTWNRNKFFHLKTAPNPKRFELVVAGSSDGVGPASTQTAHILSAGTRFVSNDSFLRAEGTAATNTSAAGAATGATYAFDSNECFDATNLSATLANCGNSAPAFASDMPLVTATGIVGATSTINSSLKTMQELMTAGVGVDQAPTP